MLLLQKCYHKLFVFWLCAAFLGSSISPSYAMDNEPEPFQFVGKTLQPAEALPIPSPVSTEQLKHQQKPRLTILNVGDHRIYTAAVKLPTNEIAYFGFEPIIDENRANKWGGYIHLTDGFTQNRSILYASFKKPDALKSGEFNIWLKDIFPNKQTHKQEVDDLVKRVPENKMEIMAEAMGGICSGCYGFNSSSIKGNYVTYISKKPIIGFLPLPEVAPQSSDLDAYITAYDHVVMVVSIFSTFEDGVFEHRGIFRNPISMLRKDYQGVGLLIHNFGAYARSVEKPEESIMTVDPDLNIKMRKMLLDNFNDEELISGRKESMLRIKVEAHKRKFLEANIVS